MKSTLHHNRSFIGLWSGQACAIFGDILYIVALIPLVYKTTGSVSSTALVPFFSSGAQLVSGILAPAIIDRFPLRSIILYFQAVKIAAILLMFLFLGFIQQNIEIVFIFVTVISFLNGWISPARSSLVPLIIHRDYLVKANGLLSTTNQIVYLSGYSLGGIIVALVGANNTIMFTIALYCLSLLAYRFITIVTVHDVTSWSPTHWGERMKEGWTEIWGKAPLRTTLYMDILETLANGVWTAAIMLVFVQQFLHKGESWWGILNSGYYIGTITGGLLAVYISKWLKNNLGRGMVLGGTVMCAFTLLFAIIPLPPIAFLLCILMGPAYQIRDIAQNTLFQTVSDERKLAKVNAARDTLVYALFGVAVLIMAQVSDHFGVNAAYLLAGILYGMSAIIGLRISSVRVEKMI